MNKKYIIGAILASMSICGFAEDTPKYLDYSAPLEVRVEDALSRMTIDEKVKMVHAQSKFSSAGVPRLGIPELWCTDGPHGIRPEVFWDEWDSAEWTNDSCTAFPALTCLAATWRPELAREYGRAIGEEARYRRKDVLLGPGVNMMRTPLNGRSFEYMGEDPFLTSTMVVPYIQGVQSNNVAACVKHFALNNNEDNRYTTDVHVSERALHEIYLKPFKAAVEGGAWAIMPAYNLFENRNGCENPRLIREILKNEWGFDGLTVSDWGGVHNTDAAIEGGLDLEMGTGTDGMSVNMNAYDNYYLANPYLERLKDGRASISDLDNRVRRILRTIFRTSMSSSNWKGRFTCPEHYATARKIGAEGIVLLKNNGILPLKPDIRKILVVGENAVKMMTVGGGSASLKVQHEITPLAGLQAVFPDVEVVWERGYIGEGSKEFDNVKSQDSDFLYEERTSAQLEADAIAKAREADVVIYIGGLNHAAYHDTENCDKNSLALPYGQDRLIETLVAVNPNLIVVNISGTPVLMPWEKNVAAIVQSWYLGSESGNSLADVLSGKVNPSGKLPFTFPMGLEDIPTAVERRYPGIKRDNSDIYDIYYDEDILIGYRWYDTKNIKVLYPFGYGLSYTKFKIDNPVISAGNHSYTITVGVTNTGHCRGAETIQIYSSAPQVKGLLREKKKLVGFKKVDLEPGETKSVSLEIPYSTLAYYDESSACEHITPGKYTFHIGNSSADICHKIIVKHNVAKKINPSATQIKKDGFITVRQENGPSLGYSSISGLALLEKDNLLFKDLDRDGTLDVYEDWRLSAVERAKDLASKLTEDQIAGLMLYSSHQRVLSGDMTAEQSRFLVHDGLRHILVTEIESPETAALWNNNIQAIAEMQPFGIPVNNSSDPRHTSRADAEFNAGGGGVISMWPGMLGLTATFSPETMSRFGRIVASEYRALGITTSLFPQVDIGTDPRWFRYNYTLGEDPNLATDLARAYTDGLQTDSVSEIADGWGYASVNAMVKHWPGTGACGEGGRDGHYAFGKYAVFPNSNFEIHTRPFTEGALALGSPTRYASALMPDYSICFGIEPEGVAPGFSKDFIDKKLRKEMSYDGVICTDWCITHDVYGMKHGGKPWGVEKETIPMRHYHALMAGCDQFGGNNEKAPVLEAFAIMKERHGVDWTDARIRKSAERLLLNMFRVGLFEMPYLDVSSTIETVACKEYNLEGYSTQLKSIVMLKNHRSILPVKEKAKVYVPARHIPEYTGYWEERNEDRKFDPVPMNILTNYFNKVENPEDADFAIVFIDSPFGCYGYDFNHLDDSDDAYLPISLQYSPYTATKAREKSIAGNNRSYCGKSATVVNSEDLQLVKDTRSAIGNKPLVVVVNTTSPFVIAEIEPLADALLLTFDVQKQAALDIITGQSEPSALLPFTMPLDMESVETQAEDTPFDMFPYRDSIGNEYEFAFGLNWSGIISDDRVAKYKKY